MTQHLQIDFISDVSCPWCAIGLAGLNKALSGVSADLDATITFHPYELNPGMPAGGENIVDHVARKYGSTLAQSESNRQVLKSRAADVGFDMAITADSRIYNTFDAHRLLHWAGTKGQQAALKQALFDVNFTENRDPGDPAVLEDAAVRAGLDAAEAREVMQSDRYAADVHEEVDRWRARGIASVPSIVINGRYLVSGGLPAADFEKILRNVAAESGAGAG